ncbi:phage head-tail connector protein [Acetobacter papayae]|uniref:phage head-tail connector protein n=1 Tax=Acetobacter papayae TaxID=1076592 RepID=UPI0039ED9250
MRRTIPVGAPAALAPLASLEDLKADLGITDNGQDARLSSLLLEASGMALAYVGRSIMRAVWRDNITIEPGAKRLQLVLGRWPLLSIKAMSIGTVSLTPEQVEALNVDPASAIIYPADTGGRLWSAGSYTIDYTAGYALPGSNDPLLIPPNIQRAVRQIATGLWHGAGRDPLLKSEAEQGVGSTSWNVSAPGLGGLPQEAASILIPYRTAGFR